MLFVVVVFVMLPLTHPSETHQDLSVAANPSLQASGRGEGSGSGPSSAAGAVTASLPSCAAKAFPDPVIHAVEEDGKHNFQGMYSYFMCQLQGTASHRLHIATDLITFTAL